MIAVTFLEQLVELTGYIYPLSRENLLSFHWLRGFLFIIIFLWCLELDNHLHTINCNIWLHSTTSTSFLYRLISIFLLRNTRVIPATELFALASIIYSPQPILWVPDFQSLLELVIIL